MLACNLVWGVGDAVTTGARAGSLQRRAHDRGLGAQATYAVGGLAALGAAALSSTVVAAGRRGAGARRPAALALGLNGSQLP